MSNQTCFRCSGLGITYEFEGGFGEKSQCKGCVGKGTIPSSYLKCKKCEGKGQIYEFEDQMGNSSICPFCNDTGFTKEEIKKCPHCEGEGKIFAFKKEKMGAEKKCFSCNGNGYIYLKDFKNVVNIDIENSEKKNDNKKILTGAQVNNATQGQKPPQQGFINDLVMSQLVFRGNDSGVIEGNLEAPINKVKSNQNPSGVSLNANNNNGINNNNNNNIANDGLPINKVQTNAFNQRQQNAMKQQINNNNNNNNNNNYNNNNNNNNNNFKPNTTGGGYQFGGINLNQDNNDIVKVNTNNGYQFGGGFNYDIGNNNNMQFNNNFNNNFQQNLQNQQSFPQNNKFAHHQSFPQNNNPQNNKFAHQQSFPQNNNPHHKIGFPGNKMGQNFGNNGNLPSFVTFIPKNIPKGYFIHKKKH